MKRILTLGIETSCDETAAAVVENGVKVLSSVIASQIEIHRVFGGVVPEVASRNHIDVIDKVTEQALSQANVELNEIDCIGVTYGAGLVGALLVGVAYAKSLAQAANKPLIAVNHIQGHASANYLNAPQLTPPFISLMVSGGHTAISLVKSTEQYVTLCSTLDDAVGEAFDKVARLLGLPYPGGPEIDRQAATGNACLAFPSVLLKNGNFSYSGLKTSVANYINTTRMMGNQVCIADVCASFTHSAIDGLITAVRKHCKQQNLKKVAISGGVASNSYVRKQMSLLQEEGYDVYMPDKAYCCDNGAMIASRAYFQFINNVGFADLTLNAEPTLKLRGEYKKKRNN